MPARKIPNWVLFASCEGYAHAMDLAQPRPPWHFDKEQIAAYEIGYAKGKQARTELAKHAQRNPS